MKKTTKILKRILELLWLTISIIAISIAIKETIKTDFNNSFIFYIFSGIAFFFFIIRRKERKNRENNN